jgi:outer membrane receptor protein involved in Fe transport
VYGADAVAGVVNFIMDSDFEGLRFDANYNFNQHHNSNDVAQAVAAHNYPLPDSNVNTGYGRDFTLALGIGGPGDKGHATFYVGYRDIDAVLQANFDYSACNLNSGANFIGAGACGGSSTSFPGRFFSVNPVTFATPNSDTLGPGNALVPYTGANAYNFGPLNYYQRPDTRYSAGAFAHYDVADHVQAYGELMFMDDRSISQIAPSGSFLVDQVINCDNPLLSPSMVQTWCTQFGLTAADNTDVLIGRRNVEGGGRQDDIGHEAYRFVFGFRGDITPTWSYDGYFQHGRTKRNSTYLNDMSLVREARSLQVRNDANGVPQCVSFLDGTDPNCVPWNVFQAGGVTQGALDYLQTPGFIRAQAQEQIAHVDFTGDLTSLVKLPSAETGLQLNIGAEYRDENTEFNPDVEFVTGDLAGQGGATTPTAGRFNVTEAFVEARLPLVEGKTGAQQLSFETGYRYSDYSTGFNTDTYKFGLDWAPVEWLRLRGSFQHAVRAPNVGELFSTQSVALDGTTDPCDGTPEFSQAQCALTGMTAAQYGNVPENPAAQYNGLLGGNPQLQPEKSDTYSYGFVFRPSFANLTVAVDYFDIQVDNVISSVNGGNADTYINQCLQTGSAEFCDLIHRDQFGSLWLATNGYIQDTSLNLGGLKTSGVDLQANYTLDVGGGHRLGFSLIGTYMINNETKTLPTVDFYDCAGLFGAICGGVFPEWRHTFRVDWRTPWAGLGISAAWRYLDGVDLDKSSSDPQLTGPVPATDARFPAQSYIDLTAAMTFADNYTLRIGANNLLDEDPPLVGASNCPAGPCNGNTFSQTYDPLGRQWFMSLTVDF